MGLGKPTGEYVEEMTGPYGWPDIDETVLLNRSTELLQQRDRLCWVIGKWRQHQGEMFSAGVWAGSGADAGNTAVESRITEMTSLQTHLEKSIAWYRVLVGIIEQAKMTITNNIADAQRTIRDIRVHPDLDESEREALIEAFVIAQNALNTSVVAGATAQVPAFNAWRPPPSSIPPPPSGQAPPGLPGFEAPPPVVTPDRTPTSITPVTSVSNTVQPPVVVGGQVSAGPGVPTITEGVQADVPVSAPATPAVSSPGGGGTSSGVSTGSSGGGLTSSPIVGYLDTEFFWRVADNGESCCDNRPTDESRRYGGLRRRLPRRNL